MAEYTDRSRFIPYRKAELIEFLCEDGALDAAQCEKFRNFTKVLESLYHFEFHKKLELMKNSYFPFNPDRDTKTKRVYDAAALSQHEAVLMADLTHVLNGANYEAITDAEVEHALREESLFWISLFVDFNDFSRVVLFRRGDVVKEAEVEHWFFRKKKVPVPTFERVVILVRFKNREYFEAKRKKTKQNPVKLPFEPGSVAMKLFKDVPKADLEMLFPNTETRMKPRDWALLLTPGLLGGVMVLVKGAVSLALAATLIWSLMKTKLNAGGAPVVYAHFSPEQGAALAAAAMAIFGIASFMGRQWMKFKNRKIFFMKTLADNLYFKNLGNNEGVLHHLIDSAEEEECKEALLAYYFLLTNPQGLTRIQLDDTIETWLEKNHDVKVDFEIHDGLGKLCTLGLASPGGTTHSDAAVWRVLGLDESCRRVDEIWDNLFTYNKNNNEGGSQGA